MGLFSKKNSSPKTDIPADILADVSVNGERKIVATDMPLEAATLSSTSPFLKPRTENNKKTIEETVAVQEEQKGTPVVFKATPSENAPQTPQFTSENGVSPRVRFPEVSSQKQDSKVQEFSRPDFSQITQDKALTEKQKEHLAPITLSKEAIVTKKNSFFSAANLVSIGVFILILGFISGGSWYYLNTRTTEEVVPQASIDTLEEGNAQGDKKTEGTILVDQPNYLILDIETVTNQQIKALLEAEKEKMIKEGVTAPVEYLVVDMNKNPVAFSRFAFLVGAATPNDLVTASLEPFSLYLFLDQGDLRIALAIALRPEVGTNFPTNKTILIQALKGFLYPEEYAVQDFSGLTFSQSSYEMHPISYANINEATNYSFDMTQQEGILTVANSKNALRAVIDKRLLVPEE